MTKLTTFGLMLQYVQLLKAAGTDAGARIYSPGDWPTADKTCPYVRARVLSEHKQSWGRNGTNFTVTGVIRLALVVDTKADADDAGAAAADIALQRLKDQIETGVINNQVLWALGLQQVPTVDSNDVYSAEGALHVGMLHEDIAVEFVQVESDFCPIPDAAFEGLEVYADLKNVFDPDGAYLNPPFPDVVVPAPRTEGPDGRSEGALTLDLPQPD